MVSINRLKGIRPWARLLRRWQKSVINSDSYFVLEGELLERDLAVPAGERPTAIPIEFRLAKLEDLPQFVDEEGRPLSQKDREKAQLRLTRGDWCVVGLHSGKIVSYGWISFCSAQIFGTSRSKLGPGWAYLYKEYTVRSFRGNGLHQALLAYRIGYLKSSGFNRVVTVVHTKNFVALHNQQKAGTRVIKRFRRLRILECVEFVRVPRWLTSYLAEPAISALDDSRHAATSS